MGKIFRYECRRLLWNKFFIGLAVVLLLYGVFVLHAVTILGVAHTAPFSPWSFGDYLSRMMPLLWLGMTDIEVQIVVVHRLLPLVHIVLLGIVLAV